MTCTTALDLVEPIAAGEIEVNASIRAHFESCPRCASALASARRIEAALGADAAPEPPPRFTQAVLSRIRRERWRAEQQVDRLFNAGIAAALVLIVGGAGALLNLRGAMGVAGVGWELLSSLSAQMVVDAVPSLLTYIAAAGLLASALGMWWWAERRLTP